MVNGLPNNLSDYKKFVSDLIRRSTTNFDPVGECIYCGAKRHSETHEPLSLEHIIPDSLGGRLLLPEASCEKCAGITSKVELDIARKLLWEFRVHMDLPSKRSKKNRPKDLPFKLDYPDSTEIEARLALDDRPFHLCLVQIEPAGILVDRPHSDLFLNNRARVFSAFPKGVLRTDGKDTPNWPHRNLGGITMEVGTICRLLAKIAHGFAVAKLGLHKFKPFLLPTIKDGQAPSNYLIGSVPGDIPAEYNDLHRVSLSILNFRGRRLVVVYIRLFAPMGMPQYEVVTGEL